MKRLPDTAPEVHRAMMNGAFVGRRAGGHHNGVSPDMFLEQIYNADAKEKSGLDGITLNIAARTKWVYTKPVTASVSTQLKTMLHLHSSNPHYESGATRVEGDSEMVVKVTAVMETNPFTTTTTHLINISTGQCADDAVKDNLIRVKELGLQALSDSISGDQQKTTVVRLNTFYTQNASRKKPKHQQAGPGKSNEVAALLRMTQLVASGGEVDIVNFIGNHECSKTPPSLFNEDGTMRGAGSKASLVKVLREETGVRAVPNLPQQNLKTAVVVDAMFAVRRWSFHKDETFGAVARRYMNNLLTDVPTGTDIIHFCCDRYNALSLKSVEQQHRYARSRPARQFEISEHYTVPDPQEFFSLSPNKTGLLNFLCETWCDEEQLEPTLSSTRLYLGGGFKAETKSVLVTAGTVTDVAALESTQQEADTRVILHAIYSVQNEDVERIIIHANDTDIVVICVYYASTFLRDSYLPIHEIAAALGPAISRALPFIHSLSGRDNTSYPYFTGKKTWIKSSMQIDIPALEDFADGDQGPARITAEVVKQAKELVVSVYANNGDMFEGADPGKLRVHTLLNNKSTLLKLLPPTESAYEQHIKRTALATAIDKSAHIGKPNVEPCEDYGWTVGHGCLKPVQSTRQAWPSVCSQSDNPTNVGFLKYCRISSDYEQYRSLLSDFNISDGDTTGMSYVVLIPAIFRGKFTSTEAENSGCTI